MKKALDRNWALQIRGQLESTWKEEMEIYAQLSLSSSLRPSAALPLVNPTKSLRVREAAMLSVSQLPGTEHGRKGEEATGSDQAPF